MKTQLDEKQDLLRKVERLSSADEVQKVKVFIAGMEAGKAIREMECDRASWNALSTTKLEYPKKREEEA